MGVHVAGFPPKLACPETLTLLKPAPWLLIVQLRETELGHTTESPGLDVNAQVEGRELTVPPMMHDPTRDKASG